MREQYYLEDMEIGAVFHSPSKTITEAHFLMFAGLTGDNHPLHYDIEYCKAHGWPERLSHGLLNMAQTCLGASELANHVHESMIAFLEQAARFTGPVFIGDTIYPTLTVSQVTPKRTTGILRLRTELHNQRQEQVLEGEHVYLMRKRPVT